VSPCLRVLKSPLHGQYGEVQRIVLMSLGTVNVVGVKPVESLLVSVSVVDNSGFCIIPNKCWCFG